MEEHVTHVEELIAAAIREVAPELAGQLRKELTLDHGRPSASRSRMLDALLEAKGPEAVYTLSKRIPHDPPESPLVFLLVNSSSPAALIDKFTRYQRYFHPNRYLELTAAGSHFIQVDDIAREAPATAADTLFVCGTLETLFHLIGCRGLTIEWETIHNPDLRSLLPQMQVEAGANARSTTWRFSWERFEPPEETPALDAFFLSKISSVSESAPPGIARRVEQILKQDLTVRYTIEDVASSIGMSQRSLQRKLADEGVSFSKLYTELRVQSAERLMQETELALTEIAYLTGFADSAHFCRVFRKLRDVSPRHVRRAAQGNQRASLR